MSSSLSMRKRVLICGEVYSPNLGDGVIADCLSFLVRRANPELSVGLMDLSARTGFPAESRPGPGWAWHLVRPLGRRLLGGSALPRTAKYCWEWRWRGARRARALWQPQLAQAGLLVIGGGQLLMDNCRRFPLRLQALVRTAEQLQVPVAFHACGVEGHWSRPAARLLTHALTSPAVISISTRDGAGVLGELVPGLRVPMQEAPDPAIWAGETYGQARAARAELVGLGMLSPESFRRHPAGDRAGQAARLLPFWVELVACLRERGHQPALFCNGAPEDQQFAAQVAEACRRRGLSCPLLSRPQRPRELLAMIAGFRAVIAHRLHAHVIACSLMVPSVGLLWDEKLQRFSEKCERARFCLERDSPPLKVVCRLEQAMAEGVRPEIGQALRVAALASVRALLERAEMGSA